MPVATEDFIRECSPFLDSLLTRHPGWLGFLRENGRLNSVSPPQREALEASVTENGLNAGLRIFRNREMLRITWRELSREASVRETMSDLSTLAEVCLQSALDHHSRRLIETFGHPVEKSGAPAGLVALAMGKLGGGELNLSSDIDLVLAFSGSGTCDGRHRLSNEQFFTRLVRSVIQDLSEINEHGFVFRVDTRLRPFGTSGPLVCSFGAMEQYYQLEGRDWERYALIKARPVAGDPALGSELIGRLRPFVFRRFIDFGAVEALHEMHDALREDASRRDRIADVKRGPGGIREVEFLVQAFQLLRGGREPGLQTPSLLGALAALRANGTLPARAVEELEGDYLFLRQVENAIQALHDRQDHVLPGGEDRYRIERAMKHAGCDDLEQALAATRRRVSDVFEDCFPRSDDGRDAAITTWHALASGAPGESSDPDTPLGRFIASIQRYSLSARARKRLDQLMTLLLGRLEEMECAEDVEDDVFNLLLAVCRRSAYLALLYQNPSALDRMLDLFSRSDWIAAAVIRHPALLDELIDPALGRELPDQDEIRLNVKRILESPDDTEQALVSLNNARQSYHLRIAVAELESSLSVHDVQLALNAVAEAIVAGCYRLAQRAVEQKHGRLPVDELAIVGYGTLGAKELSYDSDLDLIFLYESCPDSSDGSRPLDAERYHTATVRRLLSLLTAATTSGRLFDVDTRLRPNGRSGLLVSSLPAFENYQLQEAWTWELQALCRGRHCTGSVAAGETFSRIRQDVLSRERNAGQVREQVVEMRKRVHDAHTHGDPLKHGSGGLVDIEFVCQLGLLLNGSAHPRCLAGTSTKDHLVALHDIGWLNDRQFLILSNTHTGLTAARHQRMLCGGRREIEPPGFGAADVCAELMASGPVV